MQTNPSRVQRLVAVTQRALKKRQRRRTRQSLFEILEPRQMLVAALNDLHLMNDTGSSASDLVTSDPRVAATVAGDFAGGYVQIEFDHFGDGSVNGTVTAYSPDAQFTYDPRSTDPSLPAFVANFLLNHRVTEYDSNNDVVFASDWQSTIYTLAPDDSPPSARDLPGDSFLWAQPVQLAPGQSLTLGDTIGNGGYGSADVDLYAVQVTAGQTLEADVDAHRTGWGSLPGGLDSYLRIFDAAGSQLASSDNDSGRFEYYSENLDSYLLYTPSTSGTYYVAVSGLGNQSYDPRVGGTGSSGSTGSYLLQLKLGHPNDQGGVSYPASGYAYEYRHGGAERWIGISNETAREGDQVRFTVTRSGLWDQTIAVPYQTRDRSAVGQPAGATTGWYDYVSASGTLIFGPGQRSQTLYFDTIPDWEQERDEQFYVELMTPWGDRPVGVATIVDDPANVPRLGVTDVTVEEGQSAEFTVTIDGKRDRTVAINYATVEGSASDGYEWGYYGEYFTAADADFVRTAGTLTFEPGERSKTIVVDTIPDWWHEDDERFFVRVSGPWQGVAFGQGTIQDDPSTIPHIVVHDPLPVTEGEVAVVGVSLTGAGAGQNPVIIQFSTRNGSAQGSDYYYGSGGDFEHSGGTLTFAPGESYKTIPIQTLQDWTRERPEQFFVELTTPWGTHEVGTISVSDGLLPTVTVSDAAVNDGSPAVFSVQLSSPSERTIALSYSTTDGTAQGSWYGYPIDYASTSGQLTFQPGETVKTVSVETVDQDDSYGGPCSNRDFFLSVYSPWDGATLGRSVISHDDYSHCYGGTPDSISAVNDFYSIPHDSDDSYGGGLHGNVISNDHYGSYWYWSPSFRAALVGAPEHGTVQLFADGSFRYIADAGFVGADSFTYQTSDGVVTSNTATVAITVTNDTPNAVDDQFTAFHGSPTNWSWFSVLDNDTDSDTLTAALVEDVQHGTLRFFANGTFSYRPDPGFVGEDSFRYAITDGVSRLQPGVDPASIFPNDTPWPYQAADTATVRITVDVQNNVPAAEPGTLTVQHDSTNNWSQYGLLSSGNDAGVWAIRLIQANPSYEPFHPLIPLSGFQQACVLDARAHPLNCHGLGAGDPRVEQTSVDGFVRLYPDGQYRYDAPEPFSWFGQHHFLGQDTFVYALTDGYAVGPPAVVTIYVTNDAPQARSDPQSTDWSNPDPEGLGVGYSTWTHHASGVDAFSGNDDGFYVWNDDDPQTYDLVVDGMGLLHNDTDLDRLTVELISCPTSGRVELAEDGTFKYWAEPGFSGDVSFAYRLSDGIDSDTATVRLAVHGRGPDPAQSTRILLFEESLPTEQWFGSFELLPHRDACGLPQPPTGPGAEAAIYVATVQDGTSQVRYFAQTTSLYASENGSAGYYNVEGWGMVLAPDVFGYRHSDLIWRDPATGLFAVVERGTGPWPYWTPGLFRDDLDWHQGDTIGSTRCRRSDPARFTQTAINTSS